MLTSGFTNTPTTKLLLFGLVFSSILVSIRDSKHLFWIQVDPHLWRYRQAWRMLVWQACYGNATEVLFAAMVVYHLRVVERAWGTRKFASFILSTLPYTSLLPPILLALLLRPLSLNTLNYLPSGPTPLIFALLAQYHATIPHSYKYRVATTSASPHTLLFSDKSYTYVLAAQLALSQLPGSAIGAAVGWVVGYAWRGELLWPARVGRWRVPVWVVGGGREGERFEGLRRRLGEDAARASGVDAGGANGGPVRRTLGTQILDQFRGAF
ncbi:MAG: hypothetical protein M1839_008654 [Geoglossum umbratile]|nr:MAG: hypothetical protein M1839_008654 [Geoglossum umbratile]